MQKYKHLIFDLDGTLTESRKVISPSMKKLLRTLSRKCDITVISGAEYERIVKQLVGFKALIMAQSGADAWPLWRHKIPKSYVRHVWAHIRALQRFLTGNDWKGGPGKDGGYFVEHRGSQITFSLIGHPAPIEMKKMLDPDGTTRAKILLEVPFKYKALECRIAGTTCLDYTMRRFTKGKSVARLIARKKWHRDECLYIGDKLYSGGNDETVVGVIDTLQVKDPKDCEKKIKDLLLRHG